MRSDRSASGVTPELIVIRSIKFSTAYIANYFRLIKTIMSVELRTDLIELYEETFASPELKTQIKNVLDYLSYNKNASLTDILFVCLELDGDLINIPLLLIDYGLELSTPHKENGLYRTAADICIEFNSLELLQLLLIRAHTFSADLQHSILLSLFLHRDNCTRLLVNYIGLGNTSAEIMYNREYIRTLIADDI